MGRLIMIQGEVGGGKSSIRMKFEDNIFINGQEPQFQRSLKTIYHNNGKQYDNLEIFEFRYNDIQEIQKFYKYSEGIMLVYDTKSTISPVPRLELYLEEIKTIKNNPTIVIVGNKIDESNVNETTVNPLILEFCNSNQFPHFLVSAKTGENIHQAFNKLLEIVKEKEIIKKQEQQENSNYCNIL